MALQLRLGGTGYSFPGVLMKDFLEVDAALARDIIDQHTTEGQYDTTYPLFIVV